MINPADDCLDFLEEDRLTAAPDTGIKWRVLVVDDDEEVHQATVFALSDAVVCGRRLELFHAYSSADARVILESTADIAVILLDVVMERDDAGLELVRTIRGELELSESRIILRTGQPGYAPELSVIRDYDINDYRTKSDLTHTRLLTTLTTAIRSYEQICTLSSGRRGLEVIALGGSHLLLPRSLTTFAEEALAQLTVLLSQPLHAVFCGPLPGMGGAAALEDVPGVLAASGRYRGLLECALEGMSDQTLRGSLRRGRAAGCNVYEGNSACLYLGRSHGKDALIHVEATTPLSGLSRSLLDVLCVSLRVGFENVVLFERLNFYAYFDPLTRLPNRTCFLDRLDTSLSRLVGKGWMLGIIDIVRFSELNDALGHRSGDILLTEVTKRLNDRLGPEAFVARVAGDAFGVCWPPGREGVAEILSVFSASFFVRGHAIPMRARAGFAEVVQIQGGAVELLKRANLALSQAKQQGDQHWRFFSSEMEANTQSRVQLLNELRSALHLGKGLELFYQPQVRKTDHQIVGCEALIRWFKPDGQMVSPDAFIPLAEYTGLIVEIGDWVIAEACRQIVKWECEGLPPIRVGINISAAQFREPDFVSKITNNIAETGVDPARLELEITESVAMEDPASVARQLRELKALGVSVAVDDFGCGFSSLGSLNRLPFDRVKIDRAFVRELTPATSEDCIARLIVKLASSLGLQVTAEGVETDGQALLLESMGCEEMQGFLYGRPMAAVALGEWMKERR